jgi:hypothetical protein
MKLGYWVRAVFLTLGGRLSIQSFRVVNQIQQFPLFPTLTTRADTTTTTTATIFPLLLLSSHNSKREKSPNLLLQNLWTCWRSSSLFLSILFGFLCLVSSSLLSLNIPLSSLAPSFPLPSLHVTTTYVQVCLSAAIS